MSSSTCAVLTMLIAAALSLSINLQGLLSASAWHKRYISWDSGRNVGRWAPATLVFVFVVFVLHVIQALVFGAAYRLTGAAPTLEQALVGALFIQSTTPPPVDLASAPFQGLVSLIAWVTSVVFLIRIEGTRPDDPHCSSPG